MIVSISSRIFLFSLLISCKKKIDDVKLSIFKFSEMDNNSITLTKRRKKLTWNRSSNSLVKSHSNCKSAQPWYNLLVLRAQQNVLLHSACVCVFTHVPYLSDMCNGDVAGALVHQREAHPRRWRWRWSSSLWPALSGLAADELCSHDGEKWYYQTISWAQNDWTWWCRWWRRARWAQPEEGPFCPIGIHA